MPVPHDPPAENPVPRARAGLRPALRRAWPAALVALLAGLAFLARTDPAHAPEQGPLQLEHARLDETEWLCISLYTWQLVVTGEARDRSRPAAEADGDAWLEGIQVSTFGWMNPLFPKLVFGPIAASAGLEEADRLVFPRFAKHRPDPQRASRRARERFLPALARARLVPLVLAALAAALLWSIGRRLAGSVAGAAAAALWTLSPSVLESSQWVRTDLFPVAASLSALALVLAHPREAAGLSGRTAQLGVALLLGLAAGLAVGSKLNGALLALAVGLWLPVLWALAPRARRPSFARGPLLSLCLAGLVCAALFWALSPRLWSDPIGGLVETMERWRGSTLHQQRNLAAVGKIAVAHDLGEKLRLGLAGTLGRDEPLRALFGLGGGALLLLGGLALLVLAAIGRGARRAAELTAHRDAAAEDARFAARARSACALTWILVTLAGTTLWLPIDWPRFFLPYMAPMVLLEALVLGDLARRVFRAR